MKRREKVDSIYRESRREDRGRESRENLSDGERK